MYLYRRIIFNTYSFHFFFKLMFKTSINKNFDGATDKLPLVVSAVWALSALSWCCFIYTYYNAYTQYIYIYIMIVNIKRTH